MIRFGKIEDIEEVNVIRKQVNDLHVAGEPTIFRGFVKEIAEYIKEFISSDNKKLLVCEEGGKILAFAMLEFTVKPENVYRFEQKYVDVQELGVLEGYKSKGYGKMLVEEIKKIAKDSGYPKIELNVWSFNKNALKFYEKMGFEEYRRNLRIEA